MARRNDQRSKGQVDWLISGIEVSGTLRHLACEQTFDLRSTRKSSIPRRADQLCFLAKQSWNSRRGADANFN
jgi:hypothetical protein